jgi:diacylglycerol kinase (ATP)
VVEKLKTSFDSVDVVCPKNRREATEAEKTACGKYDALIVVGGDGTFNNAVNALATLNNAPVLGYINNGTIGDVGKPFGIGKNLKRSLKTITAGHIRYFDVGEENGRYFAYVCATGQYSDVSYLTPRRHKKIFGKVAYYNRAAFEALRQNSIHATITANGVTRAVETPFLMVLNGTNIAGFKVNRDSKIDDGKMELYYTEQGSFNGLLHFLFRVKTRRISAPLFVISTDRKMPWCLDGEPAPSGTATIVCHQKMLRIFSSK